MITVLKLRALCVSLVFLCAAPLYAAPKAAVSPLLEEGLRVPAGMVFVPAADSLRSGKNMVFRSFSLTSGSVTLKVEITKPMDPSRAAKMRAARERVYGNIISPVRLDYFNAKEENVALRAAEKGEKIAGHGGSPVYIFPAGEGLKPVTAARQKARYRAAAWFLYCASRKSFVELVLFFPAESFTRRAALAKISGFSCR